MTKFIYSGEVGDLQIGLSRTEIEKRLGRPVRWLGKPPTIGPIVATAEAASVWYYYNDAVGVSFDESGLAAQIHIVPSKVDLASDPFRGWPIGPHSKMVDFRAYLSKHHVPFLEVNETLDTYYIIAGGLCVAFCFPYDYGKRLPKDEREIVMIQTVVSESYLPKF